MPPKDGDQWRINFSRVEWDIEIVDGKYRKLEKRPEHNWVWSPQGVIDMHRPERWGYLQFSTAKPGEAKFKPDVDWDIRDTLHRAYYAQKQYLPREERQVRDRTERPRGEAAHRPAAPRIHAHRLRDDLDRRKGQAAARDHQRRATLEVGNTSKPKGGRPQMRLHKVRPFIVEAGELFWCYTGHLGLNAREAGD